MNTRISILLFFAAVIGLSSCKDKDLPPAGFRTTPLMVINATADTLNYYLDGTRQNNTSDLYPGGSIGYINTRVGMQNYQFKRANSGVALFNVSYTLDSGKYYSMFVAGDSPDKTFKTVDALVAAADTLNADTLHVTSMIRFINASFGSGPLDVVINNNDTARARFNNKNFGDTVAFKRFRAVANNVKVFLAGTTTLKLDTFVTFQTGNIYTLFAKGLLDGKGATAFSIGLTTNRQ